MKYSDWNLHTLLASLIDVFCGFFEVFTAEYIHTCIRMYIPQIRKCVAKTIGCGANHKYTGQTEFLQLNP